MEASARRIRHDRYAEERMMRTLAGWIALTPELPAKLLLGRQVWDYAQRADLWVGVGQAGQWRLLDAEIARMASGGER